MKQAQTKIRSGEMKTHYSVTIFVSDEYIENKQKILRKIWDWQNMFNTPEKAYGFHLKLY